MKILMQKFKSGIYAQRYEVLAKDQRGRLVRCLIFPNQANTYAAAVKFFNKCWAKTHTGLLLMNAAPFDSRLALCA